MLLAQATPSDPIRYITISSAYANKPPPSAKPINVDILYDSDHLISTQGHQTSRNLHDKASLYSSRASSTDQLLSVVALSSQSSPSDISHKPQSSKMDPATVVIKGIPKLVKIASRVSEAMQKNSEGHVEKLLDFNVELVAQLVATEQEVKLFLKQVFALPNDVINQIMEGGKEEKGGTLEDSLAEKLGVGNGFAKTLLVTYDKKIAVIVDEVDLGIREMVSKFQKLQMKMEKSGQSELIKEKGSIRKKAKGKMDQVSQDGLRMFRAQRNYTTELLSKMSFDKDKLCLESSLNTLRTLNDDLRKYRLRFLEMVEVGLVDHPTAPV
ncbi:hypothetical protein BJ508DRAFT_308058 [Ascobolus immersus RN42]|uniref:Uncharacterized protein n=1 Tax=Ascobolus immersus RN42 TaxID=1160509 RepID=A0A3N4I180_ASCIM|nr:hypothetical protein BJ508DRAFT_308058 [Ascobolus immersus RN42]